MVHENARLRHLPFADGTRGQGPSWKGIWGRPITIADGTRLKVDENYIRESILEPQKHIVQGYEPIMPTYQGTAARS